MPTRIRSLSFVMLVAVASSGCTATDGEAPANSPSSDPPPYLQGNCVHKYDAREGAQILLELLFYGRGSSDVDPETGEATLEKKTGNKYDVVNRQPTDESGCARLIPNAMGEFNVRGTAPENSSSYCSWTGQKLVTVSDASVIEVSIDMNRYCA